MKTRFVTWFIVLLASAAHADYSSEDMRKSAEAKDWPQCLMAYHSILRSGVKDDARSAALGATVGGLAVGATPTYKDLAAECLAQAKAAPDAVHAWTDLVSTEAGNVWGQSLSVENHQSWDVKMLARDTIRCSDAIALASQIIDPTTPTTVTTYGQPEWKGPFTAAQKFCDEGTKAVTTLVAPYAAAGIKGDKLAFISSHLDIYLSLPGGETSSDPKDLAAANVLFLVWDGDVCGVDQKISRVERFQFDGSQKLVSTTSKEYCGEAPSRAFH